MGINCLKCNEHIYYYANQSKKSNQKSILRCGKCCRAVYCSKCRNALLEHNGKCKENNGKKVIFEYPNCPPQIDYILLPEEMGGALVDTEKSFKMDFQGIKSDCYEVNNGTMCVVMNKKGNFFLQK